ncbi:MAG: SDR family NAD(P)-dependent oxidoreductase [Alphaproteobacteria bacterium]|nr:MAG: SDR family NAD(P)-dependent oxidoreductase [Alphaproteobacteria bacterium]
MKKIKHNLKKIAVITGASEGIGAALVNELLQNNYKVIAVSRNIKKLSKLKSFNSKYKSNLEVFSADVTNSFQLLSVAKNIGPPDLLILNAGIYEPVSIENFSVETFIKQSEINYLGVIKSFDAFIKKMLLSRSGTVLIMSSIAGWIGLPKASAYAPTKSALKSFAQSIRYDLAKYNIVVKLCSPGFVNTKAVKVNDFKMPGLMEPNVAAKIILKNINSKKFEITFPWLFSSIMKFLTYLPDNLSYKLIKYVTLNDKEK